MNATLMLVFLVTLIMGVPIAFTMVIAGLAAVLVQGAIDPMVAVQNMFAGIDSFPLLAIPFFILAAELMTGGALTEVLLRFAVRCVGHVRGGLGHTNILTLTFFSGISGSALADAAGPGAIIIRMMRRAGYPAEYAAALTASDRHRRADHSAVDHHDRLRADREQRVRHGPVPRRRRSRPDDPGALLVVNHWVSVRRNYRVERDAPTLREICDRFVKALPALMLPVIILGGIHFGVFTPTEASAVAVFYALVVGGSCTAP